MRTPKDAAVAPSTITSAGSRPAAAAHAPTAGERVLEWIGKHRQASAYGAAALFAALAFVVWSVISSGRVEAEARANLAGARMAFDSRNLALAASELARVRENFSGSLAAEEATLLLAQVRLLQGENEQSVQMLQELASGASAPYRAQAHGLLGAALENSGKLKEAAQSYEQAADAAELDAIAAPMLSDAARTWLAAGDTTRAISLYRRLVKDYGSTPSARESSMRLGEVTKGASVP